MDLSFLRRLKTSVLRVYRKGRPIAVIIPIRTSEPSWKREITPVSIPGSSGNREILKDRAESAPFSNNGTPPAAGFRELNLP
jgi:hypothetical protein